MGYQSCRKMCKIKGEKNQQTNKKRKKRHTDRQTDDKPDDDCKWLVFI